MINWGILGTGLIARALAVSMQDSIDSNLLAAASRTIENAEKFGSKYNCLSVQGYENLIKNEEIQAIYIASLRKSGMPVETKMNKPNLSHLKVSLIT